MVVIESGVGLCGFFTSLLSVSVPLSFFLLLSIRSIASLRSPHSVSNDIACWRTAVPTM